MKATYIIIFIIAAAIAGISGSSYGLGVVKSYNENRDPIEDPDMRKMYLMSSIILASSFFTWFFSICGLIIVLSPEILG